jgi:hypothetical protein
VLVPAAPYVVLDIGVTVRTIVVDNGVLDRAEAFDEEPRAWDTVSDGTLAVAFAPPPPAPNSDQGIGNGNAGNSGEGWRGLRGTGVVASEDDCLRLRRRLSRLRDGRTARTWAGGRPRSGSGSWIGLGTGVLACSGVAC